MRLMGVREARLLGASWVWFAAAAIGGCGSPAARGPVPEAAEVEPAPTPATTSALVTYQPFSATYRGTSRRNVEQEFNGQRTTTSVEMDFYLSTELAQAEEALRAIIRVDSVPLLNGLPARDAAVLTGAVFTAVLTPTGELREFEGSDREADLVRQLSLQLRQLFPQLLPRGAEPGQHWSDTSETDSHARDLQLSIRTVSRHQVLGWDQWAGEEGLHIKTISDYTLTGTGFESGQEYTLEGAGIEHADRYLAADGRFLGHVSVDTLRSTAFLPTISASIPITQTRTDSLTIVQ